MMFEYQNISHMTLFVNNYKIFRVVHGESLSERESENFYLVNRSKFLLTLWPNASLIGSGAKSG